MTYFLALTRVPSIKRGTSPFDLPHQLILIYFSKINFLPISNPSQGPRYTVHSYVFCYEKKKSKKYIKMRIFNSQSTTAILFNHWRSTKKLIKENIECAIECYSWCSNNCPYNRVFCTLFWHRWKIPSSQKGLSRIIKKIIWPYPTQNSILFRRIWDLKFFAGCDDSFF